MAYELRLMRIKCHNIPEAVKVYASYGNKVFSQGGNRIVIRLFRNQNITFESPEPKIQYSESSNLYLFKTSTSVHQGLALFASSSILLTTSLNSSVFPIDHSFAMHLEAPDDTISSGSCTVHCKIFMASSNMAHIGALV